MSSLPSDSRLPTPSCPGRRIIHRVRTGCKTCRTRRVKCDEGKPHCKRCISTGRQCDGFFYFGTAGDSPQQRTTLSPAYTKPTIPLDEFKTLQDIHTLFYVLPRLPTPMSMDLMLRMRNTTSIYMAFLPSRAGKNGALDAATHCLSAAVRWYYVNAFRKHGGDGSYFGESETEVLEQHTRALGQLCQALNDPKESLSSETLCATQLLCCFESFSPNGSEHALARHILGVEQIMKHRLPRRFKSQFDLQLFQSLMGYMSFTAFSGNTKCFLHHKSWLPIYEGVGSLSAQLKLLADYFIFSGPIFNLMVDCTLLITSDDHSQEAISRREPLLGKLIKCGTRFLDWYRSSDVQANLGLIGLNLDNSKLTTTHKTICCKVPQFVRTCNATILLQFRLRIALDIRNSFWLEERCRKIAKDALWSAEQQQYPSSERHRFEFSVPEAFLSTTDEWLSASSSSIDPASKRNHALVPTDTYLRWAREMGVAI